MKAVLMRSSVAPYGVSSEKLCSISPSVTLSITTPCTSQEQQKEVRVSLEIYFCFLTSSQQLQASTSHKPSVRMYTIQSIDYLLISESV